MNYDGPRKSRTEETGTQRQAEIPLALDTLLSSVEVLEREMEVLASGLTSVLRQEPAVGANEKAARAYSSPLANTLSDLIERVNRVARRVSTMNACLEL